MRVRRQILGVLLTLGIILGTTQVWAQSPSPSSSAFPLPQLPTSLLNSVNTELRSASVRLDGRRLFTIAAPVVSNSNQTNQNNQNTAIDTRVQNIEATLARLANQSPGATPTVQSNIEPSSNLPVLTIDQQYLMTVTTLDAQLQGTQPETYANQLTQVVRDALVQARRERQPEFLVRQSLNAIGIIAALGLTSWALSHWQKRLRRRQKQIHAEIPDISTVAPNTPEAATSNTQLVVQRQLEKRQQHAMKDVQRRLLQVVQLAIWAIGGFFILGLFPYTRSLQPIVLSTPLKVVGILIGIYLLIRLSDIVIDRVFSAFNVDGWKTPAVTQRIALRISTFSRIAKSLAAIGWVSIGMITLLSIVGIQVLPLLAGAGIIGLGISLASQNLIKDVINGFFILLEDQYAVGDVIQVGTVTGLVEHMTLRITQIRNAEGRLITIPNSTVAIVENLSKDWSRVDLAISLAYDVDVDRAIRVIQHVGQAMSQDAKWQSKILEPPEVLGVDALDSQGITLRVWIKTEPIQQWTVGREFRRRLKQALDEQGIAIGVPQQALSVRGFDEHAFDSHNRDNNPDHNTRQNSNRANRPNSQQ